LLRRKFAEKINNQTRDALTIRGLFEFKKSISIPVEEVEPNFHVTIVNQP